METNQVYQNVQPTGLHDAAGQQPMHQFTSQAEYEAHLRNVIKNRPYDELLAHSDHVRSYYTILAEEVNSRPAEDVSYYHRGDRQRGGGRRYGGYGYGGAYAVPVPVPVYGYGGYGGYAPYGYAPYGYGYPPYGYGGYGGYGYGYGDPAVAAGVATGALLGGALAGGLSSPRYY